MCCKRLAENTGRKKVAKNRHLGTIAQLCRAISSQLRHVSTIGKKLVKQHLYSVLEVFCYLRHFELNFFTLHYITLPPLDVPTMW